MPSCHGYGGFFICADKSLKFLTLDGDRFLVGSRKGSFCYRYLTLILTRKEWIMEISNYTPSPSCCQEKGGNVAFSASETRIASISESQSLDMSLVTAEGDKVTLSYDAYAAAIYAQHGQVEAEGNYLGVQWTEFSAGQYERELMISVEGDLNDQEREEIREALKTIGHMLRKFVQGHMEPMMAKAGELADLETIASLDVSMAYERQVVTAKQTDMALAYDRNGVELDRPMSPVELGQGPLEAETESLVKGMAEVAREVRAPRDHMLQMIERMLTKHRKDMVHKHALGGDLFDHIKERFKAFMAREDN